MDSPSEAFEAGAAAYSTPPNAAPGPDGRRPPREASYEEIGHPAGSAAHVPAGRGGACGAGPTAGSGPDLTGGATVPKAVKWYV